MHFFFKERQSPEPSQGSEPVKSSPNTAIQLPTEEQIRRYSATADRYDQIAQDFRYQSLEAVNLILPQIVMMLSSTPAGGRVLDAGCGAGVYTNLIASLGYKAIGVDISPGQIALARSMTTSPSAEYKKANLVDMQIRKGEFDAILFNSSLHHILKQDRKKVFGKMHEGLSETGKMLLITRTHPASKEDFIHVARQGRKTERIASRSTLEELLSLIADSDFIVDNYLYSAPHPTDRDTVFQHLLLRKRREQEPRNNISNLLVKNR